MRGCVIAGTRIVSEVEVAETDKTEVRSWRLRQEREENVKMTHQHGSMPLTSIHQTLEHGLSKDSNSKTFAPITFP